MSRLVPVLAATLLVLAVGSQSCPAQDEDPVVAGKRVSEWLDLREKAENKAHRRAAVLALGIAGPKARGVIGGLNKALRQDKEAEVRREAAQMLRNMAADAPESMEYLADALKEDKDDTVRMVSAVALGRMAAKDATKDTRYAKPALPVLIAALKDKHAGTRAAAVEAVGEFKTEARDAVPGLLEAFLDKDNDRFIRSYAAISLSRVGGDAQTVVPALVKVLAENISTELREVLIEMVAQYGEDAVAAVDVLTPLLKDPQVSTRRKAAAALGQIGPEARSAMPALREILKKDSDKLLICYSLRTLGTFGSGAKDAVPDIMVKCRVDAQLEVRLAAIEALARIGPDAKEAVPALLQAQKDSRMDVRDAATEALKKIQAMP